MFGRCSADEILAMATTAFLALQVCTHSGYRVSVNDLG